MKQKTSVIVRFIWTAMFSCSLLTVHFYHLIHNNSGHH